MVGVEGVAQPEGVGGEAESDPEDLGADVIVLRRDDQYQSAESHQVQGAYRGGEGAELPPVATVPRPGQGGESGCSHDWGSLLRFQPRADDRQPLPKIVFADDPASQQRVRQGHQLVFRERQIGVPGG